MWTCIQHLVEKLLRISKLFQNVKYFILYAEHVALSSFSDDWKDIYAENNSGALDWGEVSRSLGERAQGMTYENTPSSSSPTYETAKRPGASQAAWVKDKYLDSQDSDSIITFPERAFPKPKDWKLRRAFKNLSEQ